MSSEKQFAKFEARLAKLEQENSALRAELEGLRAENAALRAELATLKGEQAKATAWRQHPAGSVICVGRASSEVRSRAGARAHCL